MSFRNTLARILTLLTGGTPTPPPVNVTNTTPEPTDSRETLALKWEKILKDNA
jgi:hypothetical protein